MQAARIHAVPVLACLALFAGLVGVRASAAQRPAGPPAGTAPLWISDSALDDGRRLLLIVDPSTRHAAIYHVDAHSGGMQLKSTRDLSWDLVLDDFNALEPKPAAMRRLLDPAATAPAP